MQSENDLKPKSDLAIIKKYFDIHGVSPEHRARSTLAAPESADYIDAYLIELATKRGIADVAANRERLLEIAVLIEEVERRNEDLLLSDQTHARLAQQPTATGSATSQTPSKANVTALRALFDKLPGKGGGKRARKTRKSRKVRKSRKARKSRRRARR